MVDFALQRRNMVESQVRASDVTDRRVIAAMLEIPREEFVPDAMRSLAYTDGDVRYVSAGHGRAARGMMGPRTLARLLDLARIERGDVVLDVGAGSGYSAAVLARLAETVVALESDAGLAERATKVLAALSMDNVAVVKGPLHAGWPAAAPYGAIIVQGSVEFVPPELLDQLGEGGRLVTVETDRAVSRAVLYHRRASSFDRRVMFDATAPALPGFVRSAAFTL